MKKIKVELELSEEMYEEIIKEESHLGFKISLETPETGHYKAFKIVAEYYGVDKDQLDRDEIEGLEETKRAIEQGDKKILRFGGNDITKVK